MKLSEYFVKAILLTLAGYKCKNPFNFVYSLDEEYFKEVDRVYKKLNKEDVENVLDVLLSFEWKNVIYVEALIEVVNEVLELDDLDIEYIKAVYDGSLYLKFSLLRYWQLVDKGGEMTNSDIFYKMRGN